MSPDGCVGRNLDLPAITVINEPMASSGRAGTMTGSDAHS